MAQGETTIEITQTRSAVRLSREQQQARLQAQQNTPLTIPPSPTPTPEQVPTAPAAPQDFSHNRTQDKLAARQAQENRQMRLSSESETSETDPANTADDVILLGQAVLKFFALIPPGALFVSYHLRLLGGNIGFLKNQLYFANLALEEVVLAGTAPPKGAGLAGVPSMGQVGTQLGGSLERQAKSYENNISGLLDKKIAPLHDWQFIVLVLAWFLLFLGALLPFIPLLATLGGVLAAFCGFLPSVCSAAVSVVSS